MVDLKAETDANMFKLSEKMTEELNFIANRMKQRLLYQIGLIDDPWIDKDDYIMDDLYSQDQENPMEVGQKLHRSQS